MTTNSFNIFILDTKGPLYKQKNLRKFIEDYWIWEPKKFKQAPKSTKGRSSGRILGVDLLSSTCNSSK